MTPVKLKRLFTPLFFLFFTFSFSSPVWAANLLICHDNGDVGIKTALGCIPAEMGAFVQWLLPKFFSVAGGIAFLLMVYGFILMATSGGDAKKVEGARETVTSAITGLLFSIFALFLLRLVAVDILHIPGINK